MFRSKRSDFSLTRAALFAFILFLAGLPDVRSQTAIQPSRTGAFLDDLRAHDAERRAERSAGAPSAATSSRRPQGSPSPRDAYVAAARSEAMAGYDTDRRPIGEPGDVTDIYADIYQQRYSERYGQFAGPETIVPYETRPPRRNTASSSFRTDYFPRSTTDARNRNFSVGPVDVKLGATAYVEYDDNVLRSSNNQISDFVVGGILDVSSTWQFSRTGRLDLQVGLGVERYLDHHDQLSTTGRDVDFFITPNSVLSLDFFVGDVLVNIHDRLAVDNRRQDSFLLDDQDVFGSIENEAGISILWPINSKVDLAAGYDFFVARSLSDDYEFIDRDAHEFFISPSYSPHGTWRTGLESGITLVDYLDEVQNDVDAVFVGAFFDTPLSRFTNLRVAGGYQSLDYDRGGLNGDIEDHSGAYGNIAISNQLNNYFRHTFTAGREAGIGVLSNFTVVDYVRYGFTIDPDDGSAFSAGVFYENEMDSDAIFSEDLERTGVDAYYRRLLTRYLAAGVGGSYSQIDSGVSGRSYDQFTASADLTYSLTRRTDLSLIYRYWTVDADDESQDFDQNRVTLSVSHSF
ncbi:hypothetical protein BH23VER1_BH23VER1_27710 [soil metagenome]